MPGPSIDALTARFFDRYDRNRDGQITIKGPITGTQSCTSSEAAVHSQTVIDQRTKRALCAWNKTAPDFVSFSGVRALAMKDEYISAERLFRSADKDGDNTVTRDELAAAIRFFDADSDQRLQPEELLQLNQDFGESRGSVTYRYAPMTTPYVRKGDTDTLGPNLLTN